MWKCIILVSAVFTWRNVFAPPPRNAPPRQEPPMPTEDGAQQQQMLNLSYERYLMEVVKILEKDEDFQKKLAELPPEDLKEGKIAEHVDKLGDDIRSKLNEAKIKELDRLKEAIQAQIKLDGGHHNIDFDAHLSHLDSSDLKSFSKEDLQILIKKTVKDLDDMDVKRKEDFKEYEMKKEAKRRHDLNGMTEEEKARAQKEYDEAQAKHNKHQPVHHPGSKPQLKEVWEEKDQMDADSFEPKTFFMLHDIDGNGFIDEEELEALFQIELDKVYNNTQPDYDMRERDEEMERMREHVMKEIDKNGDRMVSLDEFMESVKSPEFEKDENWDVIGDEPGQVYTEEELKEFERQFAAAQGWELPYPPATPPQQQQPDPNQFKQQQPNQQQQQHPNQQQQQYQQQQQHPNQQQQQYQPQQQQQQQYQPQQQQQQHPNVVQQPQQPDPNVQQAQAQGKIVKDADGYDVRV